MYFPSLFLSFSLCVSQMNTTSMIFFSKGTVGFFQSLLEANRKCFTPKQSTWAHGFERGKTDLKMLPISLPAAIFHGNSLNARKM